MTKEVIPEQEDNHEILPEARQELSQVASSPQKNILILVAAVVVFVFLLYQFIFSEDSSKSTEVVETPTNIIKPAQISQNNAPPIPTLPEPPQIDEPVEPPIPPSLAFPDASAPPIVPVNNQVTPLPQDNSSIANLPPGPNLPSLVGDEEERKKRIETKRKSAIILIAGTVSPQTLEQIQEAAIFNKRGDMNLVLGRGKILDAVVESAINTDFGGEIRAVISRDIYSEWGKNILIPKGSRIFGLYGTDITSNYGRIQIAWNRIDLVNGYTINLSADGIDQLGRKGTSGRVDNKFMERLSNSVLTSALNIALAKGLDTIVVPQASTQSAATQTSTAIAIQNLASSINSNTDPRQTSAIKFASICTGIQTSIQDKTSTAYTSIVATCGSLQTQAASYDQKLSALMTAVNGTTNALLQSTNQSTEQTKAQKASEQAFTDIGNTIKKMVEEHEFKPTITIDQGTLIKVYVNRDYKFPKDAVHRVRYSI